MKFIMLAIILILLLSCLAATGQTPSPTTSPDPKSPENSTLFDEGIALMDKQTPEGNREAREKFRAAKTACGEDPECVATAIFFTGRMSDLLSENSDAIRNYLDALAMFRELKISQTELIVLNNLGLVYSNMGDRDNAILYFNAAIEINKNVKNQTVEGMIHLNLGKLYFDGRQIDTANGELIKALAICTDEKADQCIALSLDSLGAIAYTTGENLKALDYFDRARKLAVKREDKRAEGNILANTGKVYNDLGDSKQAEEYLNLALKICRSAGFQACEASALGSLGEVRARNGDIPRAIEFFDLEIAVSRSATLGSLESMALVNKANLLLRTKEYKRASESLERAIRLVNDLKLSDFDSLLSALNGIAQLNSGEPEKALVSANRAVVNIDTIPNRADKAVALYAVGVIFAHLGESQKALSYLTRSMPLAREVGDKSTVALTLNYIAGLNLQFGKSTSAIDNANEALSISRSIGDKQNEVMALVILGRAAAFSDPNRAIELLKLALDLATAESGKDVQAVTLTRLGEMYFVLGRPHESFDYLNRALPLAISSGDKLTQVMCFNLIGLAYSSFGQYEKGLSYINQGLEAAKSMKYRGGEAVILTSLGKLSITQDEPQKAIAYLTEAIEIARSINDKATETNALANLGAAYYLTRNMVKGLELSGQALALFRETGDHGGEVVLLTDLGYLNQKDGQFGKALTFFRQALTINTTYKYRSGQALLLGNLMVATSRMKSPEVAIFHGKQAINIYQEMRTEVRSVDEGMQKSFLHSVAGVYRYLADLLISQGRISEAEQVLDMLKEEEAFTYLRRDDRVAKELLRGVSLSERERDAVKRFDEIADKTTAMAKEFNDLDQERAKFEEGKFPKQVRYDALRTQVADANTAFQKFLDELKVTFGKHDARVAAVDSSLQNTLKRLKASKTVVVSPIVGEDRLNLIVTTAGAQRAHRIDISETAVNAMVAEFRQALTNPKIDPRPAAQKLYDILIKPIEGDLAGIGADTILWSLDGTLRYLPTAALWDKEKGYVAERYSSVVLTLASRDTLILPVAGKENWNALGVGVSRATEGFDALKAVPDELDCIVTDAIVKSVSLKPICQSGVMTGKKLLDDKFTLAAFEGSLGRYPIIHIASHFSLNPGNDKDSFLLLGGGDQRRFTVEELRSLSLTDVELIVLSACNTATPGGERTNGVEIDGFGDAAQKQGAKAVLASLWSVADDSTREWMVKFYTTYAKPDINKAEAVRQAQVAMMHGKYSAAQHNTRRDGFTLTDNAQPTFTPDPIAPYAHPYYWSPFVLFGNWK